MLRAALAGALLVQGASYFGEPNATPSAWFVGIAALLSGLFLLIGFLTPIAGILVALGSVAIAGSLLPAGTPNLFDSKLAIVFGSALLLATIVLGPGAFSVDARLFGRREIIIPPRCPSGGESSPDGGTVAARS